MARILEHSVDGPRPLVLTVDASRFPGEVWRHARDLVAFRLHRHQSDGTTRVDAAVYLVRDSGLYRQAAAALRGETTNDEHVWCRLAGVIAHERAHTAPDTERIALQAEAAQLRRCFKEGHLDSGDARKALDHVRRVEAALRNPREHIVIHAN